jgi:hypothetical protein
VTSQHSNKQRSWRPDPTEYKDSQDVLADHGRTMTGYLGAALRWLNDDPERALAVLGPFWPEAKLGRPPSTSPNPGHPSDPDQP